MCTVPRLPRPHSYPLRTRPPPSYRGYVATTLSDTGHLGCAVTPRELQTRAPRAVRPAAPSVVPVRPANNRRTNRRAPQTTAPPRTTGAGYDFPALPVAPPPQRARPPPRIHRARAG